MPSSPYIPQFDFDPTGDSPRSRRQTYGAPRGRSAGRGYGSQFDVLVEQRAREKAAPLISRERDDFAQGLEDFGMAGRRGDMLPGGSSASGSRGKKVLTPAEAALKASKDEMAAATTQKARTTESATYHKKNLKAFDEGAEGLELAQLQAGVQKDEKTASERVGIIRGALTPGVEAGDATEEAKAAQGRLAASRERLDALAEKRARMERQASESEAMSAKAKAEYHRMNDDRLGLTNEGLGRAAVRIDTDRLKMGLAPIVNRPEVAPPRDEDYNSDDWVSRRVKKVNEERAANGRSDFIDPKTMAAYGGDKTKRRKDGGLELADETAIDRAVVQNGKSFGKGMGQNESEYARSLELGRLKASGYTHIGAQPIDKMIERYGGEDRIDSARIVEAAHRAKARLAEIDEALPGMTPKAREVLQQEQMVLKNVLAEKEDLAKERGLWDEVRDPYWFEKVNAFTVNAAKGAAGALVDTGESLARNAKYAPNLILPGITKLLPDSLKEQQAKADEKTAEFAQAMREEAESWNWYMPKQVKDRLEADFITGDVAKGVGSTAAFFGPSVVMSGIGRVAGLGEKALGGLLTTTVAATGAASNSNSFRREAMEALRPQLDAGEITREEFDRAAGLAELAGGVLGATEAVPFSRFARRVGDLPAGKTFMAKLLEVAGRSGGKTAAQWMKGQGRKMLVDVVSEGLEEAGQEWVQAVASDLAAKQIFDPSRDVDFVGAAKNAAVGGLTGLMFSGVTNALQAPKVAERYRELGDAVKRGAKKKTDGGGDAPGSGVTPGSGAPPPSSPSGARTMPEPDDPFTSKGPAEVEADDELAAELGVKKPAPAEFIGVQEMPGGPGFDLYNLTADIPGHPKGSSVSRETLEKAGFTVPPRPAAQPISQPSAAASDQSRAPASTPAPGPAAGTKPKFDKSSTQVTLPPAEAKPFQDFAKAIPEADVYTEDGDYGRETEPHITALYGINNDDVEPVRKALAGIGPVTVTLGETSAFENKDKPYDVLKVGVDSPALKAVNAAIKKATDNSSDFPDYKPHLTLAYVKKGAAKKYVGDKAFAGKTITFDSLQFRTRDGRSIDIPLGGQTGQNLASQKPASTPQAATAPVFAGQIPAINPPEAVGSEERGYRIPRPSQGPDGGAGSAPNTGSGRETAPVPASASTAGKAAKTTPAAFVSRISSAAKVRPASRQQKFLADFARRLSKASPDAFASLQIKVVPAKEWAESVREAPDSRAAFQPGTNTLFLNADRVNAENIVELVVHEAGHFAERFYLGEEFTQAEWEKLSHEQRLAALKQYDPTIDTTRISVADLMQNRRARAEWVAMQFARVVRGDTQGMSAKLRAGLEKFLRDVREMVRKWIGDESLTTAALDAKILEMLGYQAEAETTAPQVESTASPAVAPEPVTIASLPAKESVTEDGPKVEPTAATDRKVSRLADRVQMRVQKAFLLGAVNQQIAEAPEELVMSDEGKADLARFEAIKYDGTKQAQAKAEQEEAELGQKYGVDFRVQRGKLDEKAGDELRKKIQLAHAEHVTIEVPGDGTFRIPHTKRNLTAFAERIRKAFGTGLSPLTGASRTASTEGKPVTPLATKVGPAEITEAVGISQSKDETRYVLNNVVQIGPHTVATDGRRLTVAIGGRGMPEKQAEVARKGKYPNFMQVLPKDRVKITDKTIAPIGTPQVTADAAEVIKVLDRIEGLKTDKGVQTVILHNIDGKLGISFARPDTGDYRSDGLPPEHKGFTGVDSDYLRDAMVQARKMGRNEVPISYVDDRAAIALFPGKNAVTIIMPVRTDDQLTAPEDFNYDAEAPKPKAAPAPTGTFLNGKRPEATAPVPVAADERQRIADGTKRVGDTANERKTQAAAPAPAAAAAEKPEAARPEKYSDLIIRANRIGMNLPANVRAALRMGNEALAGRVLQRVISMEKDAAAKAEAAVAASQPGAQANQPPAKPSPLSGKAESRVQSFKETRTDLLNQIDAAIETAPDQDAFIAEANKAIAKDQAAEIERQKKAGNKNPKGLEESVQKERRWDYTRDLAVASVKERYVTVQSGNSKFRVTNTKQVLERLRSRVEKNIGRPTDPTPSESARTQLQVKSGYKDAKTDVEKRFWIDQMSQPTLVELKLDGQYTSVAPGVTLTKEAADAIRSGKEGFDVLGAPVDRPAILSADEINDPEAAQATARTLRQAARVAGGGSGAVSANQSGRLPSLREQEEALKEWAGAAGLMIEPTAFAAEWRKQGSQGGAENQVYFDEASQRYVKRNALLFNDDWVSFFRRIMAHNRLFPDTAYLFHGFTPMDDTQPDIASKKVTLQAVISQPVVRGEGATIDEIGEALVARGFEENGLSGQFEDERFILDDLGGNNVLKDEAGNIRFIDPQVSAKPGIVLGSPADGLTPPKNAEVPGQPGYRFRSHPDTLIERGLDAIRQVYKTQDNATTAKAAKAFLDNLKDDAAAVAAANDDTNTMPGAVRTAVKLLVEQKLVAIWTDEKADPKERAAARRKWDRLVESVAERGTDLGQEIQAFDMANRITPDGVLLAAGKAVKARQEKIIGEDGKKAVDEAADALQKENEKAIDKATADMNAALRAVKVGKSIWQRYRDSAVKRWISSIENANGEQPAEPPPLVEFTNRLVREVQARIDDTLPKSEPRPPRTPAEIIREAVDNRAKYKEAWDAAREQLGTKYADKPEVLEKLDEAMMGLLDRPYSDKTLDRAIKEAHKEMGETVRDLARMHYRQADALGQTLAEKIAKDAGLKPEDAERLANLVKARMSKLTAEAKKKVLTRLIEGKNGRSRRIFGAADRIIELSNFGALSKDEYFDAVAKELDLPGLTDKQATKLRELAEKAQTTPEGFQRDRVLTDLLTELLKVKGIGTVDVATAVYYAHILSGYTTQMVNAVSTAMNTAADVAVMVARRPTTAAQAIRGIRDGAKTGFVQALSILDTGYAHRSFDEKMPEVSPILEALAKDTDRNAALRAYAKALRYVSRGMKAMDAVFFQSASEAYQRVAAARLAAEFEGGRLNWQERSQKVRDLLAMSPAEFEAARQQAKAEGLTGLDYQLRVGEILRQKRDAGLVERGVNFGREATFNQAPRGYLGVAAKAIRDASNKFPPLRLFVPFTNVVANVANASLNYSPVGAIRAVRGYGGEGAPSTTEERDALLMKGIAGSMGLIFLLAYGMGDDDEEMPWITGLGPKDTAARNQLRKTGWKPNTVKIGNAYVSYLETPLAIPLAIVGAYIDGVRYNGLDHKAAGERLAKAIATVPETIVSMSFLRGLADFMDAARGRKDWGEIGSGVVAGVTVPNLVRQIDRTFDPTLYETSGVVGGLAGQIPGVRQTFPERIDVVGQPIQSAPIERFGRAVTGDELWDTLTAKQAWIPEAGKATKLGGQTLTPAQYRAYVQLSGPGIETRLRAALPRLKLMTKEQADDFVAKVTREERARVKPQLRAIKFDVD